MVQTRSLRPCHLRIHSIFEFVAMVETRSSKKSVMTHEEQAGQPTEVEYEDGHFRSPPPRLSSTQPVVLSPELKEKVLVALRKDSVPVLSAGASSTVHPPSIGLTEALSLISDRLMAMDAKLDNVASSQIRKMSLWHILRIRFKNSRHRLQHWQLRMTF